MEKIENTTQKKQVKQYVKLGILGALVLLLAVMPMLAASREAADSTQASILSAAVENKDIDTQIIGGGQLSGEASMNIRIPENVKLTQYLVGNGDTVKEGQPIAKVDRVSVMTAITEVQETLNYLAEEIADASKDTASTSVNALAGGTVKVIYAQEGESVQDVLLDHGALATLSLDDTMAVKIEKETDLEVGDTVCVTLADGTKVDGRVKANLEGVLTVTVEDDDYCVAAKVTVSTEDGEDLGTGELYIFSAWNAVAYSGTVSDVMVEENDSVYFGQSIFTLEDTGNSAQFQRLVDQRQEYEVLMQDLFTMYRTESITAPCDGIVTGVDKDGDHLLSDNSEGWFVDLLSFLGPEKDSFVAFAVTVTEATGSGTKLRIDPQTIYIEDLAKASAIYADEMAMTESWNYPGEITVYSQDEKGLLHSAGTAGTGDILLAIGDDEHIRWFVKLDESNKAAQSAKTQNSSGFTAFLLSDTDIQENTCNGYDNGTVDSYNDGCAMENTTVNDERNNNVFPEKEDGTGTDGEKDPQSCTGEADCTFEPHSDSCKSRCDLSADCSATNHKDGCVSLITSDPEQQPTGQITTTWLPEGKVGIGYNATLQASASGTWTATGLPADLTLDSSTGAITGTPAYAGTFAVAVTYTDTATGNRETEEFTLTIVTAETTAYTGYVAQVVDIKDNWAKVRQTLYSYAVADLDDPPKVSVSETDLTVEKEYISDLIQTCELAVGDTVLIVVDHTGMVRLVSRESIQETQGMPGQQGGTNTGGTVPGGMSAGGNAAGGMGQSQSFSLYSTDKLTVASVTSQEHMTVNITVDELDITQIYVEQEAVITVDALGGERFDAVVTAISNSGENEGGNSKFKVTLTLRKSGDMLPGMLSTAYISSGTSANVPSVRVAALEKDGAETIVYTSYNEEKGELGDPVVVTLGKSDGENVEILDGLNVGDVYYYAYYETLTQANAISAGKASFGPLGGRYGIK